MYVVLYWGLHHYQSNLHRQVDAWTLKSDFKKQFGQSVLKIWHVEQHESKVAFTWGLTQQHSKPRAVSCNQTSQGHCLDVKEHQLCPPSGNLRHLVCANGSFEPGGAEGSSLWLTARWMRAECWHSSRGCKDGERERGVGREQASDAGNVWSFQFQFQRVVIGTAQGQGPRYTDTLKSEGGSREEKGKEAERCGNKLRVSV